MSMSQTLAPHLLEHPVAVVLEVGREVVHVGAVGQDVLLHLDDVPPRETATRDDETADLERLREEFAAGTAARAAAARAAGPRPTAPLDPEAIRREYGLA